MKYIVVSHPIQYYNPWFAEVSSVDDIKVAFCLNTQAKPLMDPGFEKVITWDNLTFDFPHHFYFNFSLRPNPNTFFGLINFGLILDVIKNKPSHIVFFGYRNFTFLMLLLICRILGVITIIRGDSYMLDEVSKSTFFRLTKKNLLSTIFKLFDYAFPTGTHSERYFTAYGIPEDKIFRISHFVDDKFFSLGSHRSEQHKTFTRSIFFVGKLESKKAPSAILEALELLQQESNCKPPNHFDVHFVGSGHLQKELEARAKSAKFAVTFHGFKNQTEVRELLASADCLILPSVRNETWGLVVNEAMLCETVVIASDMVGSASDMIKHNQTGYVFPAENIAALAACCKSFLALSNHDLHLMKSKARHHASAYSLENAVNAWTAFFDANK